MGFRSPMAAPKADDPMERYYADFGQVLNTVHMRTGTHLAERQVSHLLEEARRAGKEEAAERYALALDALRDAREALK